MKDEKALRIETEIAQNVARLIYEKAKALQSEDTDINGVGYIYLDQLKEICQVSEHVKKEEK